MKRRKSTGPNKEPWGTPKRSRKTARECPQRIRESVGQREQSREADLMPEAWKRELDARPNPQEKSTVDSTVRRAGFGA